MAKLDLKINSILGGFSEMFIYSGEDQYLDAIGIDTEAIGGIGNITNKSVGVVQPTSQTQVITSSSLGEAPMWILGSSNTVGAFVYGSGGSVYALNSLLALDGDGSQWKPTSGAGNGMVGYGDYMYFATDTDIARLGPLSATAPTMVHNYWSSSDNGLGQAALTNTTYPTARNVEYPNHVLHAHNDGYVYVADYANGQGMIHSFNITSAGATTATYQDLNLPPGLLPMDIKSYGTDLAILCMPLVAAGGTSLSKRLPSLLVFWDTYSNNFYRTVPINEPWATALHNRNGELFVLSGDFASSVKVLKYLGGESFSVLSNINDGTPPPACAVDSSGDALFWGGYCIYPAAAAGAYSYGYRTGRIPPAIHMPLRISDSNGTSPEVTMLKFIRAGSPYPYIGWRTDGSGSGYTFGIDRITTAGIQASRWRTKVFNIGKRFKINKIIIPMINPVAAGDSITPTIYVDNAYTSTTIKAINSTNYPNGNRIVEIDGLNVFGYSNFFIDFSFASNTGQGFTLPIEIYLDVYEY